MSASELQRETTEVLQRLVRFNTVNPPGIERAALEYLADYLERAGFQTELLGVSVRVTHIEQRDDDRLVAICMRARDKQAVGLVDLPLPTPLPPGAEWIEAYRRWLGGR